MANVSCLRLDLCDEAAPGNKRFKLQPYLRRAVEEGNTRLVSFGGPWSNHLHALAACGRELGLETVGLIRGEAPAQPSATLRDLQRWGMSLHYVGYGAYRRRHEQSYLDAVARQFAPCIVVPEGGVGVEGAGGAMDIAGLLPPATGPRRIVLAVGTGTTLAGIAAAAAPGDSISGIAALKKVPDIEPRVAGLLQELAPRAMPVWEITGAEFTKAEDAHRTVARQGLP